MKYCPYCGAVLVDGAVSFCAECGKALPSAQGNQTADPDKTDSQSEKESQKKQKPSGKSKKKKRGSSSAKWDRPLVSDTETQDDGYDGYYDDVLPVDENRVKEGIDKDLVKKIIAVAAIMLLIVGLCVAAMYLL
jgi:uncharacterized Zn finger protein (UPF0148 family)